MRRKQEQELAIKRKERGDSMEILNCRRPAYEYIFLY